MCVASMYETNETVHKVRVNNVICSVTKNIFKFVVESLQ